jgi:SAM-dependent methyltransferase
MRVLHVAPERQLSRYVKQCPGVQWCSIDLYDPGATANMDLTRLAFHDGAFDAAICNNVLEHIPDDRRAIAELWRVIKPGGWAIVQVPVSLTLAATDEDLSVCSRQERIDRFGQDDHVRLYAWDFFDRMDASGFQVQLYGYAGDPSPAALPAGLKLHVCFKPPAKALLPEHAGWTVESPQAFGRGEARSLAS